MKIVTGAYVPDEGEFYFEERRVHIREPKESRALGIEMVYQDLALCGNLDVASNLFLGREAVHNLGLVKTLNRPKMQHESQRILEQLHIRVPSISSRVRELSGGQQQAVAIGRAVSFSPKVIIMDEPTAALALREVDKVLELVRTLRTQGISTILISHRLEDIFAVADRIMVLRRGRRVDVKNAKETNYEEIHRLMFVGK
jgi:ABC-type sugar transport system ATPase subunit